MFEMDFKKWGSYKKAYSNCDFWLVAILLRRPLFKSISITAAQFCASGLVLDVGTGPGYLPMEITNNSENVNVVGIDISRDMLYDANNRVKNKTGGTRVSFVEASVESLPFKNDTFDTVFTMYSLHLWKDQQIGISEIRRVLKPGRQALLLVGRNRLVSGWAQVFDKFGFTKKSIGDLKRKCLNAGFEDIRIKKDNGDLYVYLRK